MLVERDADLEFLDRLLINSSERRGQVVVVEGTTGSGRSELLRTFGERSAASDVLFLSVTCSRAERTLPLGAVSQLFMGTPLADGLRVPVPGLLDAGVSRVAENSDVIDPEIVRVFHGLSLALLDLTMSKTVVLAVDDVHYADMISLHGLLHLMRRMRSARCLIALTVGPDPQQEYLPFHTELLRQPNLQRIRLTPLTLDGVTQLISQRLAVTRPAPVARKFFLISSGNPSILHALIEDQATMSSAPGHAYRLALLSCVNRADPSLLQVIKALAILDPEAAAGGPGQSDAAAGGPGQSDAAAGGPGQSDAAGIARIAALTGLDAEVVCRAIHTMTEGGVLTDGRFPHPATRAAILADLPPPEYAAMHHRAACLSHEHGDAAIAVARHLVGAQRAEPAWVVPILMEAAEQSLLGGRSEFAANCLKLAYRACADEQERPSIQVRLAHAEWKHNPSAAAHHLSPLVAAVRAGQLDRPDRLVLIRHLLWHDRVTEAAELLSGLRDAAHDRDPESIRELSDFEAWLACSHPALARRRSLPPVDRRVEGGPGGPIPPVKLVAAPNTDPWLRSAAALADVFVRGQCEDAVDRAIDVLRDIPLGPGSRWAEESAALALMVLICADKTQAAAEWSGRLRSEASTRDSVATRALSYAVSAEVAVRGGDLRLAVTHAETALAELPVKAWGVTVGFPLGSLILASTRMGRPSEAAKLLAHVVPEGMFQSRWGLHYLYARGHYYLATNHIHGALADFLSCGELMQAWGLDVAGLVPWRVAAAEAWLSLGNQDQSRQLAQKQLGLAGADGSRNRGLALRQLAATSPPGRRLQLLNEALDIFEGVSDRFEQARVLSDLSHTYAALNDKRRARQLLRRALHVANMCEAAPLSADLSAISGAERGDAAANGAGLAWTSGHGAGLASGHGAGDADWDAALTDSERRVASLAVMGYTNREIAAKLYITASTVEQHLTRTYRKLNVKCRKDLPAELWAKPSRPVNSFPSPSHPAYQR